MLDHKFNLGFFPTPLHPLKNLSTLYSDYKIYIKRDDQTGLASGGNKTRKLEYLIQDAIDQGCNTVITSGAQQSNHCRQTAAACAIAGLNCHLLLGGNEPEVYDGNLLLSSILGATIHFTGDNRKGEDIDILLSKLKAAGHKPYVIPYGGSNLTGALGFANAIKELKDQLKEQDLKIDYIFFASSSGGMQGGIHLGKELFGLNAELFPINIDKDETHGLSLEQVVLNIVQEGFEKFGLIKNIDISDVYLNRDYDKDGYGVVTKNERNAINQLAKTEGIIVDPVYTGRAFYGMLDVLENKKIPKDSNVLFWHTGGLPAVFKYANDLKE